VRTSSARACAWMNARARSESASTPSAPAAAELQAENVTQSRRASVQRFHWQPYMELYADRAFDLHGRGITVANSMLAACMHH
jgi:hypothetical protein